MLFKFIESRKTAFKLVVNVIRQGRPFSLKWLGALRRSEPAVFGGWYMLKLVAFGGSLRSNISFNVVKGESVSGQYVIASESGQVCKRLVFLRRGEVLVLSSFADVNFSFQSWVCEWVTQAFAHSRIQKKLFALHPRYRTVRSLLVVGKKNANAAPAALPELWKDYCAIFDQSAVLAPYWAWHRRFGSAGTLPHFQESKHSGTGSPLMSVVVPVFNPPVKWLEACIKSVLCQRYSRWELCIADDASCDPAVRRLLEDFSRVDGRIKVCFRPQNGHISAASNSALALVKGNWVVLLDHDDLLAPGALGQVADAIKQHPEARLLYSDVDKIDEAGERSDPYFKCDWNQDLFYSQNMFSHLGVYQTSLVREVGGFRLGYEGSQDYDLALRCIERIKPSQIHHIPHVLYHWRIHADSTAHSSDAKPYAMVAGERALNDHFGRLGVKAKAESVGHGYRVRYALPDQLPMVSLIIPTRNGGKLLRQCVDSILAKTSYATYEIIIVDNGSDERATLRYLESISADPRIRVLRDVRPFNYSALNNAAVKLARGDVIGLVNDDVEVINPDWLSEMVSHALRPEVGAVGARLWYGDDTIQHAGVVLGIHGIAGHVHRYLPKGNVGYCSRAALIQAFSAVTGACLVVRKAVYGEVGGLDEALAVACNDIDLCLRLRAAGYRNIYTPYAELYHHESASRGFDDTPEKQARSAKEVAFMHARWGSALLNDPCYNPNLTLDFEDFSLAWPPRLPPFVQAEQATRLGEVAHHEV